MSDPRKHIHLSPEKGERAVLIKDAEGDWGIVVGRWMVATKKKEGTVASKCRSVCHFIQRPIIGNVT